MGKIEIERIIRSQRKTIALIVTRESTLVVRAPLRTPTEYIENLVSKKNVWIQQKMAEATTYRKPMTKEFVNGEGFSFLGKIYKLQIIDDTAVDIELKDKLYVSKRALPPTQKLIEQWYKNEASKIIHNRCSWYAKITGYQPASVRITNARKRWGSCGSKGSLNFSWRLILTPLEIIDYVVVHELVHLNERNHSKIFWNRVRSILPDYEKRKRWLKDNEGLLGAY